MQSNISWQRTIEFLIVEEKLLEIGTTNFPVKAVADLAHVTVIGLSVHKLGELE